MKRRILPRLLAATAIAAGAAASAQTIAGAARWVLLSNFNDQAVLDRETGLVWATAPVGGSDAAAVEPPLNTCANQRLGNRAGWRFPSAPELGSLFDTSAAFPWLPAGNPFHLANGNGLAFGTYLALFWTGTVETDTDGTRHRIVAVLASSYDGPAFTGFTPGTLADVSDWVLCVRGASPAPQ